MSAGRKLEAWLSARGMRRDFFATLVGIKPQTLNGLIVGIRKPSLDLAVRIEDQTGIAPRDWVA